MNTFYTAYTRSVHGTIYYFVKKFATFPELDNVPDVLEGYGMHTNFKLACRIAALKDAIIMQKLWNDIEIENTVNAKVIQMNSQSVLTAAQ